ncbi:hypothetical protein N867_17825 [Actinotalea fermentans ATCC 43279 = JCM 9966 = DSM 3133]|uniref:DUF3180 domain-containing protein n=2 Tax=Actinotalea fermentans TaxID=43671 RepID=A0A511YXS7_9CELL|nr:hypothetical protein N867_17825 [Actinotalea fermentans ATCC 43279 = JCM 9966 = DSM 3133]GEN80015.1 hypothetical protein AFE02nite_17490 [Actinotalea fermentans]
MRRTSRARVLAIALASTLLSFTALRLLESRGGTLLPVPPIAWVAVLLIAAVVGVLAWNVRQYVRGKRPGFDVLLAARTVVLASASAYTGGLLFGWYAAQVLVVLLAGDLDIAGRRDVALSAGVSALAAVVLAVVGLVAERWCEVPPPEDDEGGPGASAAGSAA